MMTKAHLARAKECRERARQFIEQAEKATDADIKKLFLDAANEWTERARKWEEDDN